MMRASQCGLRVGILAGLFSLAGCRDLTIPEAPKAETFVTGRIVQAVAGTDQSRVVNGATITVLNSNLHALSDETGAFTIGPLPEGAYSLFFAGRGDGDVTRQRLLSSIKTTRGATRVVGDVSLAENAQLTGRALINGATVGNAGVVVFVPGTDFVTTTSDQGHWLLRNLPAGSLRASAFRPGFSPASTSDLDVRGGVVTSTVDLLLLPEAMSAPRGTITGRVVVMGSTSSASVHVTASSFDGATLSEVAAADTDSEGAFKLANLPPGLYTVKAKYAGYPEARIPNLAIGAGVELAMEVPIIMAPPSQTNLPLDAGLGSASPGEDAGASADGGGDAGAVDGGSTDAGSTDGGSDAGGSDAGGTDAGAVDAGGSDAGALDAGLTDGGSLGECLTEAQCAAGLLCVNHACVNCSGTLACLPGFSCHSGLCQRDCTTNANCADGQVCRAGSCGACQASVECQDSALICDATGACVHCQNRNQCPSGKACLATGCGACTVDSECGPGSLCEQGVCLAGNCHTNGGCPSTQACVAHTCQACGQDTDCRAGELCIAGSCKPGDCRAPTDCGAGLLCRNNLCGACALDSDCGTGSLCLSTAAGLRCQTATCRINADCTGSNAGKVCNTAHQCANCTQTAECADATKVCEPISSKCVTGNCVAASDCTALGLVGQVCVNNACSACTADAQCGTGQLCLSGRCKVANCKDNSWCAGKICELTNTNPAAAQYTCRPCAPVSTINNADCGGTNRVCDVTGTCRTGTCVSQAQCGGNGGTACLNFTCATCSADVDCGGGMLCVNARCQNGNCHGTGADPNVDCPSNQVCVSNLCVGNCRSNADCGGTVANPGTNYCDLTAHACSACTNTTQCGGLASGKVCASGACVTGQCTLTGATPNDVPCASGLTCVANQCLQVAPLPTNPTPYTEAQPMGTSSTPMVVSGARQAYFSGFTPSVGSWSMAFDPSMAKVWRVIDSSGTSRPYSAWNAGFVLPAPGYPQDELFVSATGANSVVAHRADTGAPAWGISGSTAMSAVSMAGGIPQMVRGENGGSFSSVMIMRADGTKQRWVAVPCGGNLNAVVAGTAFVYAICYNGVYGIDPITDVLAWTFTVSLSNSTTWAMVWRPSGLVGPAAGDELITTATGGSSTLLGLFVPDPTGGPVVPTARVNLVGFGSVGLPPVMDSSGAAYLFLGGSFPKLQKVSMLDGATLANVTLPVSPTTMNLAGDGTLVVTNSIGGGLYALSGITITNGPPGSATLKWTVGSSSFSVAPGFPAFPPVVTQWPDGGVMTGGVVAMPTAGALGQLNQVSAMVAPGPSFVVTPPAWGVLGDASNRASAPAYDCATAASCAGTQQCVANRCVGNCRTAATCAAGQGCSLAQCGPCSVDTSCRSGEVCNAGVCIACDRTSNPNCCSNNAECGTGACVQGLCRATPNPLGTGSWLQPLTTPNSATFLQALGTDGTLYVLDTASPPALHAFASNGTPLWTSPPAPTGVSAGIFPMVVHVGTQEVLFAASSTFGQFLTANLSAGAFLGWKTVALTGLSGVSSVASMAQGMSGAYGPGVTKPAVYMTGGGRLWALDPSAAAGGTLSLLWQQPNTGCSEPGSVGNWVLIGSDATVYHVCVDGSVQAWSPDGLTSQPVGINRPGALLWTSTPFPLFAASPGTRPALGKVPSSATDVLYLSQGSGTASSVLRVAAAGVASRTEVPISGNFGFVVDDKGNAVAFSNAANNFVMLSPSGQVVGSFGGVYSFTGTNMLLTTDGLAWFVDSKNSLFAITAVQLNSLVTPTLAMRFLAPGNLSWDYTTTLTYVPQAQTTIGSALMVGDNNLSGLGYTPRMLNGFPLASGSATLTQWGTQAGDLQHRASLKTQ